MHFYAIGMDYHSVVLDIRKMKRQDNVTSVYPDMQDLTVPSAVTIQPTGRTASGIVRVLLICVTLGLDVRLPINQVIQSTYTSIINSYITQ